MLHCGVQEMGSRVLALQFPGAALGITGVPVQIKAQVPVVVQPVAVQEAVRVPE